MLITAPRQDLNRLTVQSADKKYMATRLRGYKVDSAEFRAAVLEFADESISCHDRWPAWYSDHRARGLPKDGAMILWPDGRVAKAAAKLLGLPRAPFQWPGHGTRHEAALGAATLLKRGVIFIRSATGSIHCVLASGGDLEVLKHHDPAHT